MSTATNIALEFNDFSKNYTDDMIRCVPHYLELLACFVDSLPENFMPKAILDLGCGNGNVTAKLFHKFPSAVFTLVDASSEMIELCQTQFSNHNFIYSNTYFKDFNFESEHYDLIAAGFSLHHCDDEEKKEIFNEIFAALKTDGIFSYSDLMISKQDIEHPQLLQQWKIFVDRNFPDGKKWTWLMEHYAKFDKPSDYNTQLEWLKNAGFRNVKTKFKKDNWVYLYATK